MLLTEGEEKCYRRVHELEAASSQQPPPLPKFFMEPKTHRLLTTAAKGRCLDILAPANRNIRGDWVSVRPMGLHLAVPPVPLEDGVDGGYWKYQRTSLDTGAGGIYDKPMREEILVYLQSANARPAVLGNMATEFEARHNGRSFAPDDQLKLSDFCSQVPSVDALDFLMQFSRAWWCLIHYGRIATTMLSFAVLFTVVFRDGRRLVSCLGGGCCPIPGRPAWASTSCTPSSRSWPCSRGQGDATLEGRGALATNWLWHA